MITLSQDSEALARRLAAAQSVSIDDAIRQALEARARDTGLAARPSHDTSPEALAARRRRGDEIIDRITAMPINDARPVSEIVDDLNAL